MNESFDNGELSCFDEESDADFETKTASVEQTKGFAGGTVSSASTNNDSHQNIPIRQDSSSDRRNLQNNNDFKNSPWYLRESLVKFVTPCSMSLIGMSGSGKSTYIKKLLEQADGVFTEAPSRIVFCYNIYQTIFSDMGRSVKNISFYQGVPTRELIESWASSERHLMLIFDDLYQEIIQSKDICDLTIMLSHHLHISCIYTSHNIFMNSRYSKTIATNLHYILLFTLRNRLQISVLGAQLFCHKNKAKSFVKVYDMVADDNNGELGNPLIIDNSPVSLNKQFRLRCRVLPGEVPFVYEII